MAVALNTTEIPVKTLVKIIFYIIEVILIYFNKCIITL